MIRADEMRRVTRIVEKPAEPSSTFVATRWYVLPEDVFYACALLRPSAEGEFQLSEAARPSEVGWGRLLRPFVVDMFSHI